MGDTSIGWTDKTWNPVRGCSRVSKECTNCYAEGMAARFSTGGLWGEGFAKMTASGPRWTNKIELIPGKLDEPRRWRKPCKIFVNSMSDLWHEQVSLDDLRRVYKVMKECPRHIFQVLTKRPERRHKFIDAVTPRTPMTRQYPIPNVWEGTSVGIREALPRIDDLRQTPAAVKFLSCEPLLEDLGEIDLAGIDWVIIGGESGPGARPMRMPWAEDLMGRCRDQGVPCFMKQTGGWLAKRMGLASRAGQDPAEWPPTWPQDWPRARWTSVQAQECVHDWSWLPGFRLAVYGAKDSRR